MINTVIYDPNKSTFESERQLLVIPQGHQLQAHLAHTNIDFLVSWSNTHTLCHLRFRSPIADPGNVLNIKTEK